MKFIVPKIPLETRPIIIPAKTTPHIIAKTDFLKSRSKKEAAKVPVHAPVPGKGIPTKNKRAI